MNTGFGPPRFSSTAPETPTTWRGALVMGERPRSGVPHLEAGWQLALGTAGSGPEPQGWTIEFRHWTTDIPCLGEDPAAGCFDPGGHQITIAWGAPGWPGGRYPDAEVIHTAAHEFCHYLRFRRTGHSHGPGCLTLQHRG